MGFAENGSKRAAIACENSSLDACMNWVLGHMGDDDFNDPILEAEAATEAPGTPRPDAASQQVVPFDPAQLERVNLLVQQVALSAQLVKLKAGGAQELDGMLEQVLKDTEGIKEYLLKPRTASTAAPAIAPAPEPVAEPVPLPEPEPEPEPESEPAPEIVPMPEPKFSIAGSECLDAIWSDALLQDEESGANRQMGFLFLYEVVRGIFTLNLCERDCTAPGGDLLTRYFALKLARWGRESVESGEEEGGVSTFMATLAAAMTHPHMKWPMLPDDADPSMRQLWRGLNLTRKQEAAEPYVMGSWRQGQRQFRETAVHVFFKNAKDVLRQAMTSDEHTVYRIKQQEEAQAIQHHGDILYPESEIILQAPTGDLPLVPIISNASCESRDLLPQEFKVGDGTVQMTAEELSAFACKPLESLSLDFYVLTEDPSTRVSDELPFDVSGHTSARTAVAQDMLERLRTDVKGYAGGAGNASKARIIGLKTAEIAAYAAGGQTAGLDAASELIGAKMLPSLLALRAEDARFVEQATDHIVAIANSVTRPKQIKLKVKDTKGNMEVVKVSVTCSIRRLKGRIAMLFFNIPAYAQRLVSGRGTVLDDDMLVSATGLKNNAALILAPYAPKEWPAAKAAWVVGAAAEDAAADSEDVVRRFLLRKGAGQRAPLHLDFIIGALLSSRAKDDFDGVNPFLTEEQRETLMPLAMALLLRCNRICHVNRACTLARSTTSLLGQVKGAMKDGAGCPEAPLRRLNQLSSNLAESLASERYYVDPVGNGATPAWKCDPRFLVFEYVFDILLRERQVEMVQWFVDASRRGESRVQQMIMGAGKTTVIGPLLSLILADGESLVTQVMPSALLEQSRNVLRSCFSSGVMPKQIFTLQFDRSVEESVEFVAALFAKLDSARRHRSVVCAAPEAIKSMLLKYIEQLHALERFDVTSLIPGGNARANRELMRTKDSMVARSSMADALVRIMDLWKSGVLIMDEVDVLLHPLKSELNFPIGHKDPIDLAGHRWDLPIFLVDALFAVQMTDETADLQRQSSSQVVDRAGFDMPSVLADLRAAIAEGFASHALQRNPHMVLLDPAWYNRTLKRTIAKLALLWLLQHLISANTKVSCEVMLEYLCAVTDAEIDACRDAIENGLPPEGKKLLNLAQSWVRGLLPHIISKIDRVGYGILREADMAMVDPKSPPSRQLMAVPFVGKDVPSRASEFAHPDVLIGLTVLAYRYEGVRQADLHRVIVQLKTDMSRQVGPRDQRPASALFQKWIALGRAAAVAEAEGVPGSPGRGGRSTPPGSPGRGGGSVRSPGRGSPRNSTSPRSSGSGGAFDPSAANSAVLPLALFQPNDPLQMTRLFSLLRKLPDLIHFYLCQHVFPATMNFQHMKISACGHELGSSILFDRRIGFSGTPSNLLPVDLGNCLYEPGSDGKIISTLTSSSITEAEIKTHWTARSLLRDVATANPPFHALIDTGALITGMDNLEVARFMLLHLPAAQFDGVVYLDRSDRQMILLRDSMRSTLLAQCGMPWERRFSFYDQVHTTGMDIKQSPNARAVVTIGKDMTFRDFAQGAYRMRGIGVGQTITLYLIPEVVKRMEAELTPEECARPEVAVPAWLLLNSMRMESLQFVCLSVQELHNIWRKRALGSLSADSREANALEDASKEFGGGELATTRLRRFVGSGNPTRTATAPVASGAGASGAEFRDMLVGASVARWGDYVKVLGARELKLVAADARRMADKGRATDAAALAAKCAQLAGLLRDFDSASLAECLATEDAQSLAAEIYGLEGRSVITAVSTSSASAADTEWLRRCIEEYREPISFTVEDFVPLPESFANKLKALVESRQPFLESAVESERVAVAAGGAKVEQIAAVTAVSDDNKNLNSEVVHENEQEEEAEEEAEEEEQKQSAFSREDEQHNPWPTTVLLAPPPTTSPGESEDAPVYALAEYRSRLERPLLPFPGMIKITDNFFRPPSRWSGVGERRLKNVVFLLEWVPEPREGGNGGQRLLVALSLAEGETMRRLIHTDEELLRSVGMALRYSESEDTTLDQSAAFKEATGDGVRALQTGLQCLRFFNSDMYYSDAEIELLLAGLEGTSAEQRREFFAECLRLRQREKRLWGETPLAKVLTEREEWGELHARALIEQVNASLQRVADKSGGSPWRWTKYSPRLQRRPRPLQWRRRWRRARASGSRSRSWSRSRPPRRLMMWWASAPVACRRCSQPSGSGSRQPMWRSCMLMLAVESARSRWWGSQRRSRSR